MTTAELLSVLRDLGVRVWADGDRLRVSAPKGVLTEELRADLAENKTELLRLHAVAAAPSSNPIVRRVPRDARLPLSSFQDRLWVLDRLDETSTAYNLVAWYSSQGPIDREAARSGLAEVVRRHEILRSTFTEHEGQPTVVIAPPGGIVTEFADWSEFDHSAEALAAWAEAESRKPIDLSDGPIFRPVFIQHQHAYTLAVVLHHIILDAWSMGLLLAEWNAYYLAYAGDRPLDLPEPTLQYVDYAAWQREALESSDVGTRLDARVEELRDAPTVLTVPSDRQRGPVQRFDGGVQLFGLGQELSEDLRALCQAEGVTPFMAWISVFGLLLSRYTGRRDLLIGSPAASRDWPELETVLGPFVNTLVLRHTQTEEDTGRTLLARSRDNVLAGLAHADVPFERLVAELVTERTMAHPPLFQVACAYHNAPGRSEFVVAGGGAMYELTLNGFERDGMISGSLEYGTSLFDQATAERMVERFKILMRALVEHPEGAVDDYPVLSDFEVERLTCTWNETTREWPGGSVFLDAFDARVESGPERTAVVCNDERIDYGELDARANAVAHRLKAEGVEAGVTVAILAERSPEMLIAALAVMKAGGVYVPLDPEHPPARLGYILEDSGARLILAAGPAVEALPDHGLVVIGIEAGKEAERVPEPPEGVRDPDALAYAIYTSGTTGKPKGVEVTNGSLFNVLMSLQDTPGLQADDVLVAVTTFAFDIAGVELFLPLIAGATVVIATRDVAEHGKRLRALIAEHGATVVQGTPATWQMLVDAGLGEAPDELLRVWSGGEALPRALADELNECAGAVWNLYGPTETTIWSTVTRVHAGSDRPVPIGSPIANTRVYVLDGLGRVTPVGVPGELHIGGAGVARGYRNLERLTEERFIPNPFDSSGRTRLYRTGDLVRWNSDGELDYLGRLDHQVKVRGHRIELGEIESVLLTHEAIRAAAATVRKERIAAYVVFEAGEERTASDLRRFLREQLPEYMIPGFVVPLEALPMTASRKIDRASLPDPSPNAIGSSEFVPPADGIESEIAAIWKDLLESDTAISAHDNFFELGGHSLLSLQALYRMEQLMGKPLALRAIFFQTLRQVAAG